MNVTGHNHFQFPTGFSRKGRESDRAAYGPCLSIPYRILTWGSKEGFWDVSKLSIPYRILTGMMVLLYFLCVRFTFNSLPDSHARWLEMLALASSIIFQFPTGFSHNNDWERGGKKSKYFQFPTGFSLQIYWLFIRFAKHNLSIPYRILTLT